jgi:hypothetical protein
MTIAPLCEYYARNDNSYKKGDRLLYLGTGRLLAFFELRFDVSYSCII